MSALIRTNKPSAFFCTGDGYFANKGLIKSGRKLASALDSLSAATSFNPIFSLLVCSKAPRNFVNSSGPAIFVVSTSPSSCSSLSFELARTPAAAPRTGTGFEGSTFARRKFAIAGSTSRKPLGIAGKASKRKSDGSDSFRAIASSGSEKSGALVLDCERAFAAPTAGASRAVSLVTRQERTELAQLAGGSF